MTTARGHANAIGAMPWVDFLRHPDEWIAHATANGGLLSRDHPVARDRAWQVPLSSPPLHAELFHSSWLADPASAEAFSSWHAADARFTLGGSDFHRPDSGVEPGRPVTWVAAEDASAEAIVAAAVEGRTAVGLGPEHPVPLRDDDEVVALGADGCYYADGRRLAIRRDTARFPEADTLVRLETPERAVLAALAPRTSRIPRPGAPPSRGVRTDRP